MRAFHHLAGQTRPTTTSGFLALGSMLPRPGRHNHAAAHRPRRVGNIDEILIIHSAVVSSVILLLTQLAITASRRLQTAPRSWISYPPSRCVQPYAKGKANISWSRSRHIQYLGVDHAGAKISSSRALAIAQIPCPCSRGRSGPTRSWVGEGKKPGRNRKDTPARICACKAVSVPRRSHRNIFVPTIPSIWWNTGCGCVSTRRAVHSAGQTSGWALARKHNARRMGQVLFAARYFVDYIT
jgi:hypothetical protein